VPRAVTSSILSTAIPKKERKKERKEFFTPPTLSCFAVVGIISGSVGVLLLLLHLLPSTPVHRATKGISRTTSSSPASSIGKLLKTKDANFEI